MTRGEGVPPRLSGDKPAVDNGLANVGEASPWPGRSEPSGRRPPCCTRWTHSPARYHRAAASTPMRTGTRIRTGTTRQRRHRRRTPRRSKSILFIDLRAISTRTDKCRDRSIVRSCQYAHAHHDWISKIL